MFNLFTIPDRIIQDNIQKDAINVVDEYNREEENYDVYNEAESVAQSFLKVDNEYEKKFGRLYKTFDVRFLKSKIWDSVDNVHIYNIDE